MIPYLLPIFGMSFVPPQKLPLLMQNYWVAFNTVVFIPFDINLISQKCISNDWNFMKSHDRLIKNGDLSSWWETSKVFDYANFWLTGGWARKTFENVGPEKWGTCPTGVESTLEFYLRYGQNWKKVKGQQLITAP